MSTKVQAGCLLVGEYDDEDGRHSGAAVGNTEVIRPRMAADFTDDWSTNRVPREFTVVFKDGAVATVRGHGLKHLVSAQQPEHQGAFAVFERSSGEEILVAIFDAFSVQAVFHGEVRKSA